MKTERRGKPTISLVVSLVLVLFMGLAALPIAAQPGEAKMQRVIFASAGIDENNRFWVVSRPNQLPRMILTWRPCWTWMPRPVRSSRAWQRSGKRAPI